MNWRFRWGLKVEICIGGNFRELVQQEAGPEPQDEFMRLPEVASDTKLGKGIPMVEACKIVVSFQ